MVDLGLLHGLPRAGHVLARTFTDRIGDKISRPVGIPDVAKA